MLSNDNKNYLLSFIAFLTAVILAMVYWLAPPDAQSHRLYLFLIDCIPDAFVALIAFPLLYWLFIRRGISGLTLDASESTRIDIRTNEKGGAESIMPVIASEIRKAHEVVAALPETTSALLVVDVQNDFIFGSLKAYKPHKIFKPVNNAISIAKSKGMLIVFTKDWHPRDHFSFKENGGEYDRHCVIDDDGAAIPKEINQPPDSLHVHFGVNAGDVAYSALENSALAVLLDNPRVKKVYVVGIALNYCVQGTCITLRKLGKETIAIDEAIASANASVSDTEKIWKDLVEVGVTRMRTIAEFAEHSSND